MTKCGRYGTHKASFDYSPITIRKSVERSLERLHTDYLDVVYLHDVEFIATPVAPRTTGDHNSALDADAAAYGLAVGDEAKVWGPGDQQILDAMAELRKMQAEGLIKHVGITGMRISHDLPCQCSQNIRLSARDASAPRAPRPAHPAIQAARHPPLLLSLKSAKRSLRRLRARAPATRSNRAARRSVPVQYGSPDAHSARVAPCATAPAQRGAGCERAVRCVAWWASEHRARVQHAAGGGGADGRRTEHACGGARVRAGMEGAA